MPAFYDRLSGDLKGIFWMAVTGLLFVWVTVTVRHAGATMDPMQAAFIRYAMGMVFLAPALLKLRGQRLFSSRLGLHAARGLVHGIGVLLWFYAMTRLPIAVVTALGFTAPIFATVGAALFLGEKLKARRVGAVLLGFAGAMIILRPGVEAIDPGALAQLAAAPLFAISLLLSKKLTGSESNTTIVALLGVFVTLTLLPPALMVWRTPTLEEMGWLFLTASFATLGHLTMTQAFRSTDLTVTQPVSFLQLVWATLVGFYLFGEEPDLWTWVGGAVIVGSATYIAHRESRVKKLSSD